MSEPALPTRPFYVTGGTLKPGEPSYVERRADTELFESLLAGEFCYVLTARQMGKSSLMARTAARLEQAGVRSAIVDLTQIGSERGNQASVQWYFGIANKIHQQLGITEPLRPWWQERDDLPPVQRLTDFFRELVLTHCPGRVVIFVDEIDSTIGLPFADDFFAALRACFNARATEPPFERLTFVLLGVATPDQLIQDPARTPFNIGKKIDLTDFSPDEARTLAPGLHADHGEADRRLERILHWTGGHPYLTQAVCRTVRDRAAETGTAEQAVDSQVKELFLTSRAQREETNLKHARARLERPGPEGRRLLQLYRRVREGRPIPDQPSSPLFAQLKLAGVVKATEEGRLAVRNRVYEKVFTPEWAKSAMPADRGRQLATATVAATLAGVLVWSAAFQPRPYERAFLAAIQDEANNGNAYNGALSAYTALHANPFSRSRATELMQQFWEHRGLRYALAGKRDEGLLSYLQALGWKDSERLQRRARNLVGSDYERLRLTLWQSDGVNAVAFSPDGLTLATGSMNHTARLWNAVTGKPLLPPMEHQDTVYAVAFSPDGRTLATGSGDSAARIWNTVTGKALLPPLRHEYSVNAVAFSPNGRALVTASADGATRLWDAVTGKPLPPHLPNNTFLVTVAFSPDGRTLATGAQDGARLWDAVTGKPLKVPLMDEHYVHAVAFSPDGRTLATGSLHNTALLWDVATGKSLKLSLQHWGRVYSVAFSPDGRTLATGSIDRTARLWDTATGKPLTPFFLHKEAVKSVAFSRDGRTLATGSGDGTARLWDAVTAKPVTPSLQQENLNAITWSPDGRTFASGSLDGTARLWDAVTGKPFAPLLRHEGKVYAMAFSPDSRILAVGTETGTHLCDAVTGKLLVPPLKEEISVFAVAFSPDGRTLATESSDYTVQIWDAISGKPLVSLRGHEKAIIALAFSPDGRTLATGSFDFTARIWDAITGRPLALLAHDESVSTLAFSPDGRTVLTGSEDNNAWLWDAHTGKPLMPPLKLQDVPVTLAFNPDGKTFFVATDHWLNTYSWDGKKAVPLSSQLLHGVWKEGFRFPSDCERCLQVALGDTGNSFHLETLHLDEPTDPPIEGDPKKLLEKWQARLGLKFDDQMRPVPQWTFFRTFG